MKTITIIIFLPGLLFCQTEFGTVKGKVVQADTSINLSFATVALLDIKSADSLKADKNYNFIDKQIGNVSDINGEYEIKDIPLGKYIIKCIFVGCKSEIDTIEFTENNSEIIRNFYLEVKPFKWDY